MFRLIAGAAALSVLAGPALSQVLPRYSVDALCARYAHNRGNPCPVEDQALCDRNEASMRNMCIADEQRAYLLTRRLWPLASTSDKQQCLAYSDIPEQKLKYTVLESCIGPRIDFDQVDRPHHFKP